MEKQFFYQGKQGFKIHSDMIEMVKSFTLFTLRSSYLTYMPQTHPLHHSKECFLFTRGIKSSPFYFFSFTLLFPADTGPTAVSNPLHLLTSC